MNSLTSEDLDEVGIDIPITPSQETELRRLMAELKTADLAPTHRQMLFDQMQRLLDKSDG